MLCDTQSKFSKYVDRMLQFDCPTCGRYEVSEMANTEIQREKFLRGCLSIATREASDSVQPLKVTTTNWREYALPFSSISIVSKTKRLLELLRRRAPAFGQAAIFKIDEDWPLIHAVSSSEARALLEEMQTQGLLARRNPTDEPGQMLTMKGRNETEPLNGGVPGLGFAAMAFDQSMDEAYEKGMRAAVETDCGLHLLRVDREHFTDKICDHIIADIRRSQFVIADFTLQRGGVYFEAGFALGLGRSVIFTCRDEDMGKVHFDTRQYPHIIWATPSELRAKLTDRLRAVVPAAR